MKLLISVINRDDTYQLTEALVRDAYAATVISTTGGFLREGNATLLIGVADENMHDVLNTIRANCRARTQYVDSCPPMVECEELYMPNPIEIQVGGAVVFVLDVERFERF
jgi:uncharacterized protein YaaQ